MKKVFFPTLSNSISKIAATMLVALLFTACGEDVKTAETPQPSDQPQPPPSTVTETAFAAKPGGTRTSMDADRKFFWQTNDQIWVDTLKNGSFTAKSQRSVIAEGAASADFYFDKVVMNENTYDVTYTGYNSAKGTEVTIETNQVQTEVNNSDHIATSGDCGVAVATRESYRRYNFELKHKAAYLLIYPRKNPIVQDAGWTLQKIEVIERNGNTIAGTYSFGKDGLNTTDEVRNPSDTIRLHCESNNSDTGFALQDSFSDHCFVVLQPGKHSLTLRYHIFISGGTVNGIADGTFFYEQELPIDFNYTAGGVLTVRCDLDIKDKDYSTGERFYRWGANGYFFGEDNRYDTSGLEDYQLVKTNPNWAALPNAHEMFWYIKNGNPRWEGRRDWTWIVDGDYSKVWTTGVWIKKRSVIENDPTLLKCGHDSHGTDVVTFCDKHGLNEAGTAYIDFHTDVQNFNTASGNPPRATLPESYSSAGRPGKDEIDNYFFLPALGMYEENATDSSQINGRGRDGRYYSRSRCKHSVTRPWVFWMEFDPYSIRVNNNRCDLGNVFAPDLFQ